MNDLFLHTFLSVFHGIAKIFIIAAVAGILVWRNFLTQQHIDALSRITVYVFLPSLIFSSIVTGFSPAALPIWWMIPLGVIVFGLAGMGICALLFLRTTRHIKPVLPLSGMQNAAYLVLPIGEFVYKSQFDQFAVYCFLVVLGISPLIWSAGFLLLTSKSRREMNLSKVFNPPFVANLLAITLVLTKTQQYIPAFVTESLDFVGIATVPAATFILGATIAGVFKSLPPWHEALRICSVKFIFMPVMAILLMLATGMREQYPLLTDVLVIQAASAPATSLIIIVRTYGGDLKRVGGLIFISYFVALIAIPVWLSVWKLL